MENERDYLLGEIEQYQHESKEQCKEINYLRSIIQSMTQMVVVENEEQGDFMQEVKELIEANKGGNDGIIQS